MGKISSTTAFLHKSSSVSKVARGGDEPCTQTTSYLAKILECDGEPRPWYDDGVFKVFNISSAFLT